ncbi:MAG: hypothetical protein KGH72_05910 [Candidatus Micrarchaeota archaeon]|nr:hypothetical protein [Candidatus Micrarchaeota archaeon]
MYREDNDTRGLLEEIGGYIKERHLADNARHGGVNWRTYVQRRAHSIKTAIRKLRPTILQAARLPSGGGRRGRKPSLSLDQKVTILLIMQLVGTSSRGMVYMLVMFSSISGVYISYKMIERFYSDGQVHQALLRLRDLMIANAASV